MAIRVVRLTSADVERFRQVRLEGLRSDPIGFRYSEAEDAAVGTAVWSARLDLDFVVAALREGSDEILGVGATEPEAVQQGDEYRDELSMWLRLAER